MCTWISQSFAAFDTTRGLVFAVYLEGRGSAVAKGGRYDNIGAVFGRDRPATGFAIDLKALVDDVHGRVRLPMFTGDSASFGQCRAQGCRDSVASGGPDSGDGCRPRCRFAQCGATGLARRRVDYRRGHLLVSHNVVILGTQWGDEGKGKIVDLLTEQADAVVRFQGGHNAGHTLVISGERRRCCT